VSAIDFAYRNRATGTRPNVLIHCQYVYGIGHYVRTVELARGLSEVFNVFIVNGGEAVPNYVLPPSVTSFQLPAIYKEEHLDHLSPVDRSLSLADCFEARASLLYRLVQQVRADILITEHFPFGLLFEDEATRLIGQVRRCNPRAKIVCSVRDVIESEGGGQQDHHTCVLLNQLYDMVLVHGDQQIVPFSASFPQEWAIKIPVHHTGYIVQSPQRTRPRAHPPRFLVSVGGGRMGEELLYAALGAHRRIAREWMHHLILFTGAFQRDISKLQERVEAGECSHVTINGFGREHYRRALAVASAVLCLGGYNTMIEAVATKLPTLVYRRTFRGNNKEQDLRSAFFERAGLVQVLGPEELAIEQMAVRVLKLVEHDERPRVCVRMDGALEAQRLLAMLLMD
jgi:predicted glycosyltransferase